MSGLEIRPEAAHLWKWLLDQVFPRTCLRCGCWIRSNQLAFTCGPCRSRYPWIREPCCACCGRPFYGDLRPPVRCLECVEKPPAFRMARSLFRYESTASRMIHALKYEGGTWIRSEIQSLLSGQEGWAAWFGRATLIPIPLHYRRLGSRGYNQAEVISKAIAGLFPVTVKTGTLKRNKATSSQTFLTRKERLRNVRGAFHLEHPVPEGPLILVDDVLTTGATLNAAARALKEGGASGISAFTLAHG